MAAIAAPPTDTLTDTAALVNISAFDLLLIELVPLAERMARNFEASIDRPAPGNPTKQQRTTSISSAGAGAVTAANPNPAPTSTSGVSAGATAPPLAADGLPETDIFRDSMFVRLERLGFRVGEGLTERFSRDRPRFTDQLDVIKFLCKDLWTVVFKKQIDNLKTNHRGVFVLTDNKFRPFSRMSMTTHTEAIARAQPHLYFPCGIIRGVLSSLGIKATVQAETTELPFATFQIKTSQAKT
ncbi:transport protein particle component [Exophiala viscosa]|uniref:Transport protein particle component n=1 Tax=Exophiala viscosa TaxID=2486360 RepID=A0AAN6IHQ6_9EURO|nr:transport protein particle component [Exophiala viscosa]KAI1627151.1 transport protein particle component [Exophiala viscosa]